MYDQFSADYDRFVNWPARLAAELPFLDTRLRAGVARRVLDTACGTGQHALALAQRGYLVTGADLSAGMIEQARANAALTGTTVRFEPTGFGALAATFGSAAFDAVLCLGNSLPHVLTPADLTLALADFAACLRPGGLLLIQNRNFDSVLAKHERWMEPQAHRAGDKEWLFVRFYDFEPDGLLAFNILTLRRERAGPWQQTLTTTHLRPLPQAELTEALALSGFDTLTAYGDLPGAPFDPATSGNLVLVARKPL